MNVNNDKQNRELKFRSNKVSQNPLFYSNQIKMVGKKVKLPHQDFI